MKKIYILFLSVYLVLIFVSLIRVTKEKKKLESIDESTINQNIKNYLNVLIEDSTVYIPSFGMFVSDKDPEPQNDNIEKFEFKDKKPWITKAFYNLHILSQDKIKGLLYSSYPNLKVYGYLLYIDKTKDLHFDYLLQSQQSKDKVYFICEERWIYGECWLSDILLLIGLKGLNFPNYTKERALTTEQKTLLKSIYEKREPSNAYMDQLIRYYFDYEWEKD